MEQIILGGRPIPFLILYKDIKHAYLRVKPEGYLQITAGRRVSHRSIEGFIRKNEERIVDQFVLLDQKPVRKPDEVWIFGTGFPCRTAEIQNPELTEGTLLIPNIPDSKRQKAVEKWYSRLVVEETIRFCHDQEFWLATDLDPVGVTFKSQRMSTRLGSCQTQKKIIKLNSLLGRLDRKYLRAILLHELVHLRIPNHGPDFYGLLTQYVPEYRVLRRELNRIVKTIGV